MKRLTYEGNYCEDIALCDHKNSTCGGNCQKKQIWEYLKKYEDAEAGIVNCKNCAWFAPVESMLEAEKLHKHLIDTFGDILPRRNDEIGVCRKMTFCKDRPVLTHGEGFCHRAERKEVE